MSWAGWLWIGGSASVSDASDNPGYVRKAIPLGSALRLALAQAISLIDLLRPHGRLSPPTCTSRRPRQRQKKRVSKRV